LEDRLLPTTLPATAVWTGASLVDNNWMTKENWQGITAPSPGDALLFPAGTLQQSNIDDFAAGTSFASITLSAGTSDHYFLDGNNNLILSAGIIDNGVNTQSNVINLAQLTLGADQQFSFQNSSSELKINSPVDLQSFTLTLNSTVSFGTFGTSGGLRGTVSGTGNIVKTGIGGWYLASDNTYSGLTTINQGVLAVTTANGLGATTSGTVVNSGGGLILNPNSTDISIAEPITINGAGAGDPEPGAILVYHAFAIPTLTGPLTLGSNSTIFTANDPAFVQTFQISGPVNDNGFDLTLDGNLTTILTNTASINGGGHVIQNAQLLSGSCTVNCPVTVSQGTLSPGIGTQPGVLTTADVTLQSGTTYQETIAGASAGTGYSQLNVNGAVNLGNSALTATLSFTPAPSSRFVIMQSTGTVSGNFNGLADGSAVTFSGQTFIIHYQNAAATAGVSPGVITGRVVLCSAPVNTMTMVSSSQNPADAGQSVSFTATVTTDCGGAPAVVGASGSITPNVAGTVTFFDGSTPLGSSQLVNGTATITLMLLAGGHSITAVYNGNTNFSPSPPSPAFSQVIKSSTVGWTDVMTGDFDGSGTQDIAGRTANGQWWVALSNTTSFTNQLWTTWNPGLIWADVHVGDFNGDGKADIVGRASNGQLWVALSNGTGFTNQLWGIWNTALTWVDVKVGDFNGDGNADIVGRDLVSGNWWVAQSTGASFTTTRWATWNTAATWVDINVGDFNGAINPGTGKRIMGLTGRSLRGGQWFTAISTGTSFTTTLWTTWNPALTWVDVRVGDFNVDGNDDLTGRSLQGGQWFTAISTGTSFTTTLWATWNTALTWVDVRVGDFNHDGKADITGRDLASGNWWVAQSTGASFTTTRWGIWNPALPWVDALGADVDNNQFTDLIGRVSSTGQWWAAISTGTSFTNQLWTTWAP
jgi:autotransporter-associated beta strand protein